MEQNLVEIRFNDGTILNVELISKFDIVGTSKEYIIYKTIDGVNHVAWSNGKIDYNNLFTATTEDEQKQISFVAGELGIGVINYV